MRAHIDTDRIAITSGWFTIESRTTVITVRCYIGVNITAARVFITADLARAIINQSRGVDKDGPVIM